MKMTSDTMMHPEYSVNMTKLFRQHCLLLLCFLCCSVLSKPAQRHQNTTLIFSKENSIRNCSCASDIRDCDYALASLMCSCRTVVAHTVDTSSSKLSYKSDLTIWFTNISVLGQLLNFTSVYDLKLSLCGGGSLPTEYLTIFGLRSLRIHGAANAQFPYQNFTLCNAKPFGQPKTCSKDKPSFFHISFLDTALLNGNSSLKAYSAKNISNIAGHFPALWYMTPYLPVGNKHYTVTFIY
ncbi:exosomal polycystin-1-interacting protein [Latimeria chalumnae]|uniref:Exosomal polycystin 1 interacting protein n=1 Tax=Latimeria chalumnae TaxID=7897 RepID=H3AKW5_LATCH|nr:PREDICTED: uncharacterized protein C21orf62 homolog [Latimeria chalumnae]|eukprot:XP_005993681.2 PREDICTED: uncharacterized protein C21orf62 homolog [Latimeria chalumnae]